MFSADEFMNKYLIPRRPVVDRGALAEWSWAPEWRLGELVDRVADHRVPLYDTLFSLRGLSTFGAYVRRHTGARATGVPPYLRWYARQSTDRLPWADAAFADLAGEWTMPAWLPSADYVFPHTAGPVDAARDPFPAKGLFVCGRGGHTRTHVDPWASDACLCQTTGHKRVLIHSPGTTEPALDVVLAPGDCLYIPAGWPHSATALTDSVSITWNFVHDVHAGEFERYLETGGAADGTVRYFTRSRVR